MQTSVSTVAPGEGGLVWASMFALITSTAQSMLGNLFMNHLASASAMLPGELFS
jgi:hypothetical protein